MRWDNVKQNVVEMVEPVMSVVQWREVPCQRDLRKPVSQPKLVNTYLPRPYGERKPTSPLREQNYVKYVMTVLLNTQNLLTNN